MSRLRWVENLNKHRDWKSLARWIMENGGELFAPTMLNFVSEFQKRKSPPTDRQQRLLIQLAAQVQALRVWDCCLTGPQNDHASAAEGAKLLEKVLKRRGK